MSDESAPPCLEETLKHLDLVQAVITRMSSASSSAKSWMMPIVVAAYGYAITEKATGVAALGILTVLLFMYLDANYLRQEQRYRRLYVAVSEGHPLTRFSLDPNEVPVPPTGRSEELGPRIPACIARWMPGRSVWTSWSILPFYTTTVLIGVAIAIIAFRT